MAGLVFGRQAAISNLVQTCIGDMDKELNIKIGRASEPQVW
jgi:hypothetical protein